MTDGGEWLLRNETAMEGKMRRRKNGTSSEQSGSGGRARLRRRRLMVLTLIVAALALAVFVSACGGDEEKTSTTAEEHAAGPASEHFEAAEEALDKGDLKEVRSDLEEAEEAAEEQNLPGAKEHAEEALEALEENKRQHLREHIEEGLEASEQAPVELGKPTATVEVSLGEWFVKPDKSSVKAGTIEFKVTNDGSIEHEFVIVKTNVAPDKIPISGENKADVDKVGEEIGEIEEFEPGKTEEMKVKLKPGKYVLICDVAGHYKNGQRVAFTVT